MIDPVTRGRPSTCPAQAAGTRPRRTPSPARRGSGRRPLRSRHAVPAGLVRSGEDLGRMWETENRDREPPLAGENPVGSLSAALIAVSCTAVIPNAHRSRRRRSRSNRRTDRGPRVLHRRGSARLQAVSTNRPLSCPVRSRGCDPLEVRGVLSLMPSASSPADDTRHRCNDKHAHHTGLSSPSASRSSRVKRSAPRFQLQPRIQAHPRRAPHRGNAPGPLRARPRPGDRPTTRAAHSPTGGGARP